jgi:hypothetical protein
MAGKAWAPTRGKKTPNVIHGYTKYRNAWSRRFEEVDLVQLGRGHRTWYKKWTRLLNIRVERGRLEIRRNYFSTESSRHGTEFHMR